MTAVAERGSGRLIAAERRAERIRLTATSFMEARDKMSSLLVEAQREGDHETMGYRSWPEYIAALFSDTPLMRLSRDERKVIVADLAEQGMSSRAIAPVVGAHHATVARDMESVADATDSPRTVKSIDGVERTFQPRAAATPTTADHDTGENADDRKPKAEAITAQFNSAVVDLNRLMDRLHRITEQDAYTRNADKIATLYKADIDRAISDLTHIANTL